MKRGYTLLVILSIGMAKADFYYNPYNSNPTRHDVWAAEQNALMHNGRAADAVNGNAAWEERKMADQAQRDADTMRRRMHENEWQEQMRQAEADRLRRAAELRKAEVANRLLLELQQRGKEDKENDKPECEEVEEYVSANANGRFPRWNGWRQQRFHAIEGDLRRQWIERAQTSSQYNKEYLEKQRYDAYYEKWKQENRASHARAEVKRTHEVTEKKSSVRNSQKKKLVPGESIGGGFEIKRSKHGAYGLFKGDEFTGFVSTEKEDCVEWAKKLAE